eukprot:TCONS_00022574-protein
MKMKLKNSRMDTNHTCGILLLLFFLACFNIDQGVKAVKCNGATCPIYSYCDMQTKNCTCIDVVTPQRPQCGSDGQTYSSLQALQKHACEMNKTITPSKEGPCYNCTDTRCHPYTTCDAKTNVCVCKPVLELYAPVCGSDGQSLQTYDSIYHLNHTACMEERNIVKLYDGFCKGPGTCGHSSCPIYSECDRVTNKCECRKTVNLTIAEVCGSDNVTYQNEDALKGTACHQNETITVQHRGACSVVFTNCAGETCLQYQQCDITTDTCKCVQGNNVTAEVCGDDGVTYKNEDHLIYAMCKGETHGTGKKHDGKCKQGGDRLMIYILVGVGAFVLIMVIVLTIICCVRRRRDKRAPSKSTYSANDYEVPLM